jgi:lanosterol synthase
MGLVYAKYPHPEPIERAVKLVMSRQLPVCSSRPLSTPHYFGNLILILLQDGSWTQGAIEGMFNRTVAISYQNFKFSFTIWMLGKADSYLKQLKAN